MWDTRKYMYVRHVQNLCNIMKYIRKWLRLSPLKKKESRGVEEVQVQLGHLRKLLECGIPTHCPGIIRAQLSATLNISIFAPLYCRDLQYFQLGIVRSVLMYISVYLRRGLIILAQYLYFYICAITNNFQLQYLHSNFLPL
jgi:hypothetical protein